MTEPENFEEDLFADLSVNLLLVLIIIIPLKLCPAKFDHLADPREATTTMPPLLLNLSNPNRSRLPRFLRPNQSSHLRQLRRLRLRISHTKKRRLSFSRMGGLTIT